MRARLLPSEGRVSQHDWFQMGGACFFWNPVFWPCLQSRMSLSVLTKAQQSQERSLRNGQGKVSFPPPSRFPSASVEFCPSNSGAAGSGPWFPGSAADPQLPMRPPPFGSVAACFWLLQAREASVWAVATVQSCQQPGKEMDSNAGRQCSL